jgi:hypothetical protein
MNVRASRGSPFGGHTGRGGRPKHPPAFGFFLMAFAVAASPAGASAEPASHQAAPGLTILGVQVGPEDRPEGSVPRGDSDYRAERVQPPPREFSGRFPSLPTREREDHESLTRRRVPPIAVQPLPGVGLQRLRVVLTVRNDSSRTIESVEWLVASRFDGDREFAYPQGPARRRIAPGAEAELVGFVPHGGRIEISGFRFRRVEYADGTVWRPEVPETESTPLEVPETGNLRLLMDCVLPQGRCAHRDPRRMILEFSRDADAPEAIPLLVQAIEWADALTAWPDVATAHACLALDEIAENHPEANIPAESLFEAVGRKDWRSRRHCAGALGRVLAPGAVKDRRKEAVRVLVPLLLSQRPRVFETAARSLERITGNAFGPDPARWLAYYEQEYGRSLDLSDAPRGQPFRVCDAKATVGDLPDERRVFHRLRAARPGPSHPRTRNSTTGVGCGSRTTPPTSRTPTSSGVLAMSVEKGQDQASVG